MNVSRISLALSFGYFASQVYRHGKLPLVISPSNRVSRLTLGCQGKRQGSKPKALPSCLVTRFTPHTSKPKRGETRRSLPAPDDGNPESGLPQSRQAAGTYNPCGATRCWRERVLSLWHRARDWASIWERHKYLALEAISEWLPRLHFSRFHH